MSKPLRRFPRHALVIALALAASLAGCGGGGSSGGGSGSAALLVTDAPSDEFAQILLTVTKVELIGSGGHYTLFEGSRELDLLALRDDAVLLALGRDIPAGQWSKIRLHVEAVELIRVVPEDEVEGTEIDCPEEIVPEAGFVCDSIAPHIAANGKIDLNPRGPITVAAGELVFIQLDLDAVKSIHIHETGSEKYQFRPIVFIDAFNGTVPDRLVRIEGEIEEIDDAAQKILVCGTHPVFHAVPQEDPDARSRCVDVRIGAETSIFDTDGEPALLDDLAVGDDIAALGRFRTGAAEGDLVFDALWIQQGGFAAGIELCGEVLGALIGDEFTIAPDPDGPVDADELVVRLQGGAVLVDQNGDPVDPEDLEPGMRVKVFGVLVLSGGDPDRLDASLVFVRDEEELALLTGTVTEAFDPGDGTIVIQAATEMAVGPVCVALDPGTDVFRVSDSGELLLSERIEPSEIAVGDDVDVYGQDAEPCFDAATVVAFPPAG